MKRHHKKKIVAPRARRPCGVRRSPGDKLNVTEVKRYRALVTGLNYGGGRFRKVLDFVRSDDLEKTATPHEHVPIPCRRLATSVVKTPLRFRPEYFSFWV